VPALAHTEQGFAVTVVDNSPERSSLLADTFQNNYVWQEGRNLMYGPSINLAVQRMDSDLVLYACSRHGKMLDVSWVADLIAPFEDTDVGATGYLMGSNSPEGVAYATHLPWIKERFVFKDDYGEKSVPQHIQGGVFMAHTQALLECPFHPDLPHLYSDHYMTWAFLQAGWKCVNVESIMSVWRSTVHNTNGLKYIHADNFV
jgi:hypothetical protein